VVWVCTSQRGDARAGLALFREWAECSDELLKKGLGDESGWWGNWNESFLVFGIGSFYKLVALVVEIVERTFFLLG
jgi:hypothetical protein